MGGYDATVGGLAVWGEASDVLMRDSSRLKDCSGMYFYGEVKHERKLIIFVLNKKSHTKKYIR